ncbi:hypothetical protein, partial [Burkholderia glumae]|uniref:hypothetical protein n=1 Tax=Burkholderia glumae TaxID=337 RepID=UPI001E4ECFCD
ISRAIWSAIDRTAPLPRRRQIKKLGKITSTKVGSIYPTLTVQELPISAGHYLPHRLVVLPVSVELAYG